MKNSYVTKTVDGGLLIYKSGKLMTLDGPVSRDEAKALIADWKELDREAAIAA